ncbi:MAG: 5'-nucleotidase C-terminal domain-containing protein, partial [bacterium]|nr:5'-nucleotidase C-terminal domain-containing protein [bacterium]
RPSTGRSLLYSQPYSVVQAGVFRVGILGLGDRHEGIWAGDAVLAAKYYLPIIKSQADVVVLVTSLGFEADSVLAASVPGIDLIVGRFLPDSGSKTTHVNGVSIRHAGAMGQSVGRVDLVIGKSGVTVRSAQLIPLDIPVGSIDAMTVALSSWALPVAGNALSVTATLGNCLGGFGASSGQAGAMGYLIADLMRTDSGADFALLSALSLDSEMPEGPIRVADLYRVYAPNHRLAVVEMTGEDLNRLMEDGLDDLTAFFYPSGLKITYDLTRIKGERLVSLADATGRVLGGKKKFKVAIESESAQFSNKVKPSGSIKIRDLLAGHIRSSGAIEGKIDERLQER